MLRAANRTGKTFCAAMEATFHATGEYPEPGEYFYPDDFPVPELRGRDCFPNGWEGKRFDEPTLGWVATVTNELGRDVQQTALLGGLGESQGTGSLPKRVIKGVTKRQAGIGDVVDTITVAHKSGGTSKIICKTYEQGWRKFQGAAPDWVWLDEEPDGNHGGFKLYTECLTRILTSNGVLFVTFTPLIGQTDLVIHFEQPEAPGIWMITASWDDAPHLGKKERERMLASYPMHERDARTAGVPLMGSGRVFPLHESEIVCEPFPIPDHYARICGVDFGIDHPFAAVWWAIDRDRDVAYLYDVYKVQGYAAAVHVQAVKERGDWPIAWPHDGLNRGKADGVPLKDHYRRLGLRLLSKSARYKDDTGGGQPVEPVVQDMIDRMETGRLKVFSNCHEWLEEFRNYHRDDQGRIVAERDDAMKASMYGLMMKRFAVPNYTVKRRPAYSGPVVA